MLNFYKNSKHFAVTALLSITTVHVMAQTDAATLIKAGKADANELFNGYLGPLMKSFGAGLNSGWYQTAKPHGAGGFDITVSTNITFAPTSDLTYSIDGLQKVKPAPGQPSVAPTFFGDAKPGPNVNIMDKSPITGNDTAITNFDLPQGIGTNMFAVPTAQLSVGVGFGTEVGIRFVPTLSAGGVGIGEFGLAVKHDFKQWIPGMKDLPFDLSAMFGYTTMNANIKFTGSDAIQPDSDPNIFNPNPTKRYTNQRAEFLAKAWTTNVIISKKLGPFTPYLGLGYQQATTTLSLLGDFPVTVPNDVASATNPLDPSFGYAARVEDITDPVKVEGNLAGFRANAGFRLKFAVLTIHADYTFGEYNVASVGLGLNLQSIAPFKL